MMVGRAGRDTNFPHASFFANLSLVGSAHAGGMVDATFDDSIHMRRGRREQLQFQGFCARYVDFEGGRKEAFIFSPASISRLLAS